MGSNYDYPNEFVKRTLRLLKENFHIFNEKDIEVTLLLNCLLGLIVTVRENKKRNKLSFFDDDIDDHFLTFVPAKVGFVDSKPVSESYDLTKMNMNESNVSVSHKDDLKKKPKFWLIDKIRHGIAHQNIEGVNHGGKWVGVRLWNGSNKGKKKNFEIVFTIKQLRKLAIEVSNKYLSFITATSPTPAIFYTKNPHALMAERKQTSNLSRAVKESIK